MRTNPTLTQRPNSRGKKILWLILLVIVVLVVWGILHRLLARHALEDQAQQNAVTAVSVVMPTPDAADEKLVLPGTVQAWHEAPVYARVDGYLKDWQVDIGADVKAGDVLAEIETPETDQQLRQAEADLRSAIVAAQLAQITADRDTLLLSQDSIARQTADEAVADARAKAAAVTSARATRDRLKQLVAFKKVTAPFDGKITARNVDTGALVVANTGSAGTNNNGTTGSGGQELFHIADTRHLRVYVQIPENDAGAVLTAPQPGNVSATALPNDDVSSTLVAQLHFTELPGQQFPATLWRTAGAIDPATRTLLAQFVVNNASNTLLAGGYTTVSLKLPPSADADAVSGTDVPGPVRVPVNALLFRGGENMQGLQVATVSSESRVVLHAVTPGRDYGTMVEILAGLPARTAVILNPPDSLQGGQPVRIITPTTTVTPTAGTNPNGAPNESPAKPTGQGQSTKGGSDTSATAPAAKTSATETK